MCMATLNLKNKSRKIKGIPNHMLMLASLRYFTHLSRRRWHHDSCSISMIWPSLREAILWPINAVSCQMGHSANSVKVTKRSMYQRSKLNLLQKMRFVELMPFS